MLSSKEMMAIFGYLSQIAKMKTLAYYGLTGQLRILALE
jgi:hypothetical protein